MSTAPALLSHEPERAQHLSSSRAEFVGRRYLVAGLVMCFLIYLFPFVALRFGIKTKWLMSYWGTVIETSYNRQREDADIVIFGDSTAATNFDPVRMTQDLGMKVTVLPNVSTSLPVSGYAPLEEYLRHNKKPRLIVFYLSGWDLDFLHNPFTQIVEEGEEMLLLHGSWPEVWHYARKNPRKILMFPLHLYTTSNRIGDILHFRPHEVPKLQEGHITLLAHATPMKSDCEFRVARAASGGADASVREGVSEFTTPGTQTMVFISPLPRCKYLAEVEVPHPGLDIPPLQVLPPASFREDGWQAHMLTSAIGPSTAYFEAAVRQKLAQGSDGQKSH